MLLLMLNIRIFALSFLCVASASCNYNKGQENPQTLLLLLSLSSWGSYRRAKQSHRWKKTKTKNPQTVWFFLVTYRKRTTPKSTTFTALQFYFLIFKYLYLFFSLSFYFYIFSFNDILHFYVNLMFLFHLFHFLDFLLYIFSVSFRYFCRKSCIV